MPTKIRRCTAEEIYKMHKNNEFNHLVDRDDIFKPGFDYKLKVKNLVGKVGDEYIVLKESNAR